MSKEPNINEEKIAIEKAVRKNQKTIEGYIVNKIEELERTDKQQKTLINSLCKDIENYEKFVEILREHTKVGESGWVEITIYSCDEAIKEVIKMLRLEKGNKNE